MEVTNQIPLSIELAERYADKSIPNLDVNTVEGYWRENLRWRTVLVSHSILHFNVMLMMEGRWNDCWEQKRPGTGTFCVRRFQQGYNRR